MDFEETLKMLGDLWKMAEGERDWLEKRNAELLAACKKTLARQSEAHQYGCVCGLCAQISVAIANAERGKK